MSSYCEHCGTGPNCAICGRRDEPVRARFWVWAGEGWVRLSLADGQELAHVAGGPNDEGYSYTAVTWRREGRTITEETVCESRDCDGRLDTYSTCHCDVFDLGDDLGPEELSGRPNWKRGVRSQRDEFAELAGY